MPIYPCQYCDQPYQGEAYNVYLTLFHKDDKASFRFVVCEPCRDTLVEDWVVKSMTRDGNGDWNLPHGDRSLSDCWILPAPFQNGAGRPPARR